MVPFARAASRGASERLIRFGRYPKNAATYGLPAGFVEVTREKRRHAGSRPHFRLQQFRLQRQGRGGYPKYVRARARADSRSSSACSRLVNQHGIKALDAADHERLPDARKYKPLAPQRPLQRSPVGAAPPDVYIDENGDGVMDDLNHDGRSDFPRHQDLVGSRRGDRRGPAREDDGSLVGGPRRLSREEEPRAVRARGRARLHGALGRLSVGRCRGDPLSPRTRRGGRHQPPVSLRPLGARSSHWYMPPEAVQPAGIGGIGVVDDAVLERETRSFPGRSRARRWPTSVSDHGPRTSRESPRRAAFRLRVKRRPGARL